MSKQAEISSPDIPTLEKRKEAIDSGHPQQIGDFITALHELIAALGGGHDEIYVKYVNICALLTLMTDERDSKVVEEFWEWLVDFVGDDKWFRVYDINTQTVLNEYFGIDPVKEENELRELLAGQRAANALGDARKELGLDKESSD